MFCSNEAVGLGHMRRTLALAEYLRAHTLLQSQLIVTGSPVAQALPLPNGVDYVKLPAVIKDRAGRYASRSIPMPFSQVGDMRRDILLSAARHFHPEILVVDHAPAGIDGELVATLRYLKDHSPHTRLILGLRDIVDAPPRVQQVWRRTRVYELIDDLYDLVLVYGQPDVYDVVGAYGFSARAAAKTRYVGYLRRAPSARSAGQVRAELHMRTDRLVVATAGGGADGYALMQAMAEALRLRPAPFDCVLIAGPLMPAADRERLARLLDRIPGTRLLDFTEDIVDYLNAADAVVTMGGYNTICEILTLEKPAVVVPRVAPSQEQFIRARALSRRRLARMIHPDDLRPERLLDELMDLFERPPHLRALLALDGLPNAAAELSRMLQQARGGDLDMEMPLTRAVAAPARSHIVKRGAR
jgi:predicted glycosyltransferase